ncbi:MAG: hypothetical protein ACXQTI_10465 [Candidatus Nezhaarchaeales archaeon]
MKIERRGCSLTWTIGISSKGIYSASLTLYMSNGHWRVKREIKLRPKRSNDERTIFVEDYGLPEFQAIMESCQAMISSLNIEREEACLNFALRASAIMDLLISELRGMRNEE